MTSTYMVDEKFKDYKEGERVDISPDCWGVMDKMAKYIARNGGTGLAIDYGQDYIQGDTLRVKASYKYFRETTNSFCFSIKAIKNHKIISPMSDPGSADLSADVDFAFLKEAITTGSGKDAPTSKDLRN